MADISVPSGGGAIAGIGETFQPDLHTGTGNLNVPLPLPPGRGALTPSLALAYSSGAGNGPFGLGWTVAVPRISRRTDRGVPIYDDAVDVFVLSGTEELAPVPLGNGTPADLPAGAVATRYRPRTEAGFARIVHVVGPQDDYWDVWSPTGLRNRYGTARPDGAPDGWVDPAAIRTPDGAVFGWLLSRTTDPVGNLVAYTYRGDGGAQRYLDTVSYADYGDRAAPSFAVTVRVAYGDAVRPDPFSERRGGFELRTTLRASRIEITTVGQPGTPSTVVELGYADESPGGGPAGGLSLLTSIRISGQDAGSGQTQSLPPLTFDYRPWDPEARRFRRLPDTLPPTPLGPGLDLVDLFGDGLPSVLELDGGARYWRNHGDGRIDAARSLVAAPSGATLGMPGVQFGDVDADGRPELTVTAGGRTTVWPLATPRPGSDRAGFAGTQQITRAVPTTEPGSPQVRIVDLDGDHIPDLLLAGARPLLAPGDRQGGFGRPQRIEGAPPLDDLANPHIQLADMSGDGLTDIVEIHDGSVRYWPNLGHGRFGAPVQMATAPRFADAAAYGPTGFDPRRLLLGDLTGDGTADLVYVADGQITVWTNMSGNGFAPPVAVRGTPGMDDRSSVRLADVYGIGVSGVLWSGVGSRGEWAFLDLTGGAKPYLLTTVDNHRGAVTTMTWSTSSAYANADRVAGRPWRTPLPFPVHVIAGSRTVDVFAQTVLTTGYHYSDGYWDPVDREFRGFGRVEQSDTLTPVQPVPAAPPLLTPLDPLTPAGPVPSGFDAAAQGNLLTNWSLDVPRAGGPTTLSTSAAQPQGSGDSAAAGWTTWNGSAATTVTQLVASDLPQGQGGQMIHVTTDGAGCGVAQAFLPPSTGPARAVASVWVKVVRGSVRIGTGDGNDLSAAVCDRVGSWILVRVGSEQGPANRLAVVSATAGGAEFYLDHAWVRADDVPAEPVGTPPVRTVTWFALGPVGPAAGDWTAIDPTDDYWAADPPLRPHLDQSAFAGDLPRAALREALRAVRGRVLRREVYAEDGDPVRGDRPYEVHDASFAVVPVLDGRDPADPSWSARPVVAVRDVFGRTATWDRGEEPLVRLTASGQYDDYGRAHAAVDLGVARGRDPRRPGAACLGRVTATGYATRDDADLLALDRVARVARYELADPGTGPVLDLIAAALGTAPAGPLRALALTYFDGPEFTGLPLGQLGAYGMTTRVEELVLTPDRLAQIGSALVPGGTTAPPPPYLAPDASAPPAAWPAAYPAAFLQAVTGAPAQRGSHLGYVWHDAGDGVVAGYYAQKARSSYDVHAPLPGQPPRGLPLVTRDAYGGDSTTAWDAYGLLPVATTNAVGLSTTAVYDYRVLKPSVVTDANGNRTAIGFTPLGLAAWRARLGKATHQEGDTTDQPGERFVYDLTAYDGSVADGGDPQPTGVTTLRRIDHRWTLVARENARRAAAGQPPMTDAEVAAFFGSDEEQAHPERFLRTTEFTDGLGRLLQTRTQADDFVVGDLGLPDDLSPAARTVTPDANSAAAPVVVVSGWKIYDNKGRTAVAYEPFHDTGWAYAAPTDVRLAGLDAVRQHYDPLGRPTVSVAPDGSQTRVVHGRPADPADPGSAVPTPWETWTYDAEDNAGRTHPTESLDRWRVWNTPGSATQDALGRTVRAVQRGLTTDDVTTFAYDIDGSLLAQTDALGRQVSAGVYDLTRRAWATWQLDVGTRRTVHDAADGVAERRDDKGAVVLTAFDAAHRSLYRWAADRTGQTPTLRQVTGYGDDPAISGLTADQASALNARGRIVVDHDEAGRIRTDGYDADGNPVGTTRRILKPTLLLSQLPAGGAWSGTAYAVDWQPGAGSTLADRATALLDETEYAVGAEWDALGRRTGTTEPTDVTGARAHVAFGYGRGGGLTSVTVDGFAHLQQVVYDARGRRTLALLGNGILIRYRYQPRTQRLRRLRAEHATATAAGWTCDGPVVQDDTFRHDLGGRLLTLGDRTPNSGVAPTPDALDRQFGYDALGRLVSATGRETDLPPQQPWSDVPRSTDVTRARRYTETYDYDIVGNLLTLRHATDATGTGAYTRAYALSGGTNRLASLTSGPLAVPYTYDACGNLLTEAANRFLEWDSADRLATFRDQAGTAAPSVYAQYRYDASGNRVIKVVRRSSGPDLLTLYLGGFERVLQGTVGSSLTAYDELHLTDHDTRLAAIRRGPALPGDPLPQPVRYQLPDQLESVVATLADDGTVLSREEYTPYGETSFGSYARKRYRFTGKERDEESSLAYHGARYFAPWLARWVSVDPMVAKTRMSYAYADDSPMTRVDPTGKAAKPKTSGVEKLDVMDPEAGLDMSKHPNPTHRTAPRPGEKEGHPRDARWFWRQQLKLHKEWFSPENQKEIRAGRSPVVDETWLRHFEHDLFEGDVLTHHHVDRGPIAVPLPSRFHQIFHGPLHYERVMTEPLDNGILTTPIHEQDNRPEVILPVEPISTTTVFPIDPNAGKPTVLVTPITHDQGPTVLTFPITHPPGPNVVTRDEHAPATVPSGSSAADAGKAGAAVVGVAVGGYLLWTVGKWVLATLAAPETGGLSWVAAAATP